MTESKKERFIVALQECEERLRFCNVIAENQEQAEHEALAFYQKTYPGRTYSLVDPSAIPRPL
jgi:hypothetical protein